MEPSPPTEEGELLSPPLRSALAPHKRVRWGHAQVWLLTWLWPIVRKGYGAPLQPRDIPYLPAELTAAAAREGAAQWWAGQQQPTLVGMAWSCHRADLLLGMVSSVLYGQLNVVVRPLLLKLTIETVTRISAGDGADETLRSLWLILAIGASLVLEGIVAAASKHFLSDRLLTALVGKAASLVQRKAVRLKGAQGGGGGGGGGDASSSAPSSSASAQQSAAQPSTLVGSDLVRAFDASKMLSLLPMCVSGCLGGCVLLVVTIGWAGVLGIAVMVVVTVVRETGRLLIATQHPLCTRLLRLVIPCAAPVLVARTESALLVTRGTWSWASASSGSSTWRCWPRTSGWPSSGR
jgi:hypothetical protein